MNKVIVWGNNLPNTLGLIRSLGQKGMPVILMLEPTNRSRCYVRCSKYIKKIHYLQSLEDGLNVLRTHYWNENEKPILFCGGDPSVCLVDRHYDELKDRFCVFNAGGQGRINHYMEKINTFSLAEQCGFTRIKTWTVVGGDSIPGDVVFPCLVKGGNSIKSTKADMRICRTAEELKCHMREGVGYLVQEYVQKEFELNVIGLSCQHGQKIFLPAAVRKIRDDLHRQSVFIRLDALSDYAESVSEGVEKLVKHIGYEGVFSVELIYSRGKFYFLEMNLRNDGCAFIYTVAGCNLPYLWAKYGQGTLSEEIFQDVQMRFPVYMMAEDDLYNLLEGKVSIVQWLKDFWRTDAHFILDLKDPLPFVMSSYVHFKQLCKKILRKAFGIDIK